MFYHRIASFAQNKVVSFAVILPSKAGIMGLQRYMKMFLQVYTDRVVMGNRRLQSLAEVCCKQADGLIQLLSDGGFEMEKRNHSKSVQKIKNTAP